MTTITVKEFFDHDTATFTYVVSDDATKKCAIIDSVLNYDMNAGKISTNSADSIIAYIAENNLQLDWILETHIHADHLTASSYIKEKIGGKIAIGNKIKEVLDFWVPLFNTSKDSGLHQHTRSASRSTLRSLIIYFLMAKNFKLEICKCR